MLTTPLCGPRAPFASRLRVMGEGAVLALLFPSSQHPGQARAAVLHPWPCPHIVYGLPGKHSHFRGFWKAWHIPSAESKGASQGHQAFASQPQTFGPVPEPSAPNSPGLALSLHSDREFLSFRICADPPLRPLFAAGARGREQGFLA